MIPPNDPWESDDQYGWLMVAIVGVIIAMFLSGCRYTTPVLESEKNGGPKRDTVTWCETRAMKRECWEVPREEVNRAIRDLGL